MAKKNVATLARAIRTALAIGVVLGPATSTQVYAQSNASTSAMEAVIAAADAAKAAAEAAQAAAEAAKMAAEAARVAVEANSLAVRRAPPRRLPPTGERASPDRPAQPVLPANSVAPQVAASTPAVLSATPATPMLDDPTLVITREEIDASGYSLLSDFMRELSVNTAGSFRQSSGSTAQSQAVMNLRNLGADRTLVLVNGRRIAGSPTFANGEAQNLNTLPMAAIERIEILGDGASATYGENAVGGVINIVMAQRFDGLSVTASVARPEREGGDEAYYAVTGGVGGERANISFALDHAEQEIVFNRDRDYSDVGLSSFGFPGSFFAIADSGASLGTFPDPRCPAALVDEDGQPIPDPDSDFPNSAVVGSRCRYNYAGVSANEASLERNSFFINAQFEPVNGFRLFAQGIFTEATSFSRYAPTPTVGGSPFLPTISAENPNNPTNPANVTTINGDDLTPFHSLTDSNGISHDGPFDLSVFYRNVPGGFRDTIVEDEFLDAVAGFEVNSDLLGGVVLEASAQHSVQTSKSTATGLVRRDLLQTAIDSGELDIFAVNAPTSDSVARSLTVTAIERNEVEMNTARASVRLDGIRLPGVALPITIGAEEREMRVVTDADDGISAGDVFGAASRQDIAGGRRVSSVFGHASLQLFDLLEFDYRIREDDYQRFGIVLSESYSASIPLSPGVRLRGRYGTGFATPSAARLFTPQSETTRSGIDYTLCEKTQNGAVSLDDRGVPFVQSSFLFPPDSPCRPQSYPAIVGGNEDLGLERSEHWGAGLLLRASNLMSLAIDAYRVEITDAVVSPVGGFDAFADELLGGGLGPAVIRAPDSSVSELRLVPQNFGTVFTQGADLDFRAGAFVDPHSSMGLRLMVSYIDEFLVSALQRTQLRPPEQTFVPKLRANMSLVWQPTPAVQLNVNGHYIGAATFGDGSATLGEWLTWDAQLGVGFPWHGTLTLGVRNLFDQDPPIDNIGLDNPFYDNTLHNPYGIAPYLRYRQRL